MRALVLCLLLAACGAHYAREARTWAIDRSLEEVEACVGIPDRSASLPSGDQIVQWSASDATQQLATVPVSVVSNVPLVSALSIPASSLAGALPLSMGGGSCRAMALVRDGRVVSLRYAGPGDGLSGADAVCGVDLMRGCVRQ